MGFWKDVSMDIHQGMSKEKAVSINARLRYGTPEERESAKEEENFFYNVEQKLDRMP
jgi:hypothetical protein